MYAGTTFTNRSGQFIGVHQRIDRIARKRIQPLLPKEVGFPTTREILHFEGLNGPDGIKRKSPSVDEPWHFLDPTKEHDDALLNMVADHQWNLHEALKAGNRERAAFETAWMAHAIVDGLTPAHHVPLGDIIEELFGMPHHERSTVREKNLIKGKTRLDTLSKNWRYWGKHGIFMNHFTFEFGVATAILGKEYHIPISKEELEAVRQEGGFVKAFDEILRYVVDLKVYERYEKNGWNGALAKVVQRKLVPSIVKAVVLGWYVSLPEEAK